MISLKDPEAREAASGYLKKVDKLIRSLSGKDQEDIRMEITAHLEESIQHQQGEDELKAVKAAIHKLGAPEDFIQPLVEERKMNKASRTFKPGHVLSAFLAGTGNTILNMIKYCTLSVLYSPVLLFILLAIAKLVSPQKVGYYTNEAGKMVFFGYTTVTVSGKEQLGYWIVPVFLGMALIIYLFVTGMLRLFSRLMAFLRKCIQPGN